VTSEKLYTNFLFGTSGGAGVGRPRASLIKLVNVELVHVKLVHVKLVHVELVHVELVHVELVHVELVHVELVHVELVYIELVSKMDVYAPQSLRIPLSLPYIKHVLRPIFSGYFS